MKRFASTFLLFLAPIAWSQLKTGTVIYVDLAKNEFTFAADSRLTMTNGGHDDTECKILAFGNQFALAMSGVVKVANWDAHAVARRIWTEESAKQPDPIQLVPIVA